MSSVTASIVKNSDFLAENYFNFLKTCPGPNLKVFQYRILKKRSEKNIIK